MQSPGRHVPSQSVHRDRDRQSFSHTGIVAVESGSPVVYDCSSAGVQRQPFEVWMLDCVGAIGVKRLKPEYRKSIPGILGYCREV